MPVFVCSIDGNIGAGKSTLIQNFENYDNIIVIPEPIDVWTDQLNKCAENPKKFGYQLQKLIAMHFVKCSKIVQKRKMENFLEDVNNLELIIIERSLDTSVKVFANYNHDKKIIATNQFHELQELMVNNTINFNCRILVDTSINVCQQRIKKRGRNFEKRLDYSYLCKLNDLHYELYYNFVATKQFTFRIDGDESMEHVGLQFINFLNTKLFCNYYLHYLKKKTISLHLCEVGSAIDTYKSICNVFGQDILTQQKIDIYLMFLQICDYIYEKSCFKFVELSLQHLQ